MLNDRLDRGVRCEGEDSKYIVGLLIWRTPANMTAGKRYRRNWPRKVTSGLSDCSQAIESAQRSMFIAQRVGRRWRRQLKHRWIGRTVPALTSASGWPCGAVTRSPLRGLAQGSWLKGLGSGRYVGASHGSRRALLLPGRICDMNRRERRTLNIMSVAVLGAKLAHRPGEFAA
jgi:hypothetical protein